MNFYITLGVGVFLGVVIGMWAAYGLIWLGQKWRERL